MNSYVTGSVIKRLREAKGLTQNALAEALLVSDKAVSKWETGKGLPDITLLEPLCSALGVSLSELISGQEIKNRNVSGNMLRGQFYVCPVCGNVFFSAGNALISCCGITLPPLCADECDENHEISVGKIEDEIFITSSHEMSKSHNLSFFAYVTSDRCEIRKLYAEGCCDTRFFPRGNGFIYSFCNRHGLFRKKI